MGGGEKRVYWLARLVHRHLAKKGLLFMSRRVGEGSYNTVERHGRAAALSQGKASMSAGPSTAPDEQQARSHTRPRS